MTILKKVLSLAKLSAFINQLADLTYPLVLIQTQTFKILEMAEPEQALPFLHGALGQFFAHHKPTHTIIRSFSSLEEANGQIEIQLKRLIMAEKVIFMIMDISGCRTLFKARVRQPLL